MKLLTDPKSSVDIKNAWSLSSLFLMSSQHGTELSIRIFTVPAFLFDRL